MCQMLVWENIWENKNEAFDTPFTYLHKCDIVLFSIKYHRLFKIALFSHCFPEKKNQQPTFVCKLLIF